MGEGGGNYRQAGLPAELAKQVVALIREHPELGFRSLSEFARHAIIEQLRLVHLHLGVKALWATTELGAQAVEAVIKDSLPREYRDILERSIARQRREPI